MKYSFYHYYLKKTKKNIKELRKEGTAISDFGYVVIAQPKNSYWFDLTKKK